MVNKPINIDNPPPPHQTIAQSETPPPHQIIEHIKNTTTRHMGNIQQKLHKNIKQVYLYSTFLN
jgi:hypothetical protein